MTCGLPCDPVLQALQQLLGDYKEAAIASVAAFYEDAVAAECAWGQHSSRPRKRHSTATHLRLLHGLRVDAGKHARKGQPFVGGEFVAAYCSELSRKTAAIMELAQAIIEEGACRRRWCTRRLHMHDSCVRVPRATCRPSVFRLQRALRCRPWMSWSP